MSCVTRRVLTVTVTLLAGVLAACGDGQLGPKPGPTVETVSRVDVSTPATTIAPQQTVQFTAIARSSSGSAIGTVTSVWSSSANGVATVNASGIVTGIAAGTATITATAGGKSGSAALTVTSGAGVLAALTANVQDRTVQLGQTTQASVIGRDLQGAAVALGNRAVTWTTSNSATATITAAGVVTGVGVGNVDLRVSVADGATPKTASVAMTVSSIPGAPSNARVDMFGLNFVPFESVVKQNGTVSFVFPSLAHNVIWDRRLAGAPGDVNTMSNVTITRTFPAAGVFNFTCTLHPGMDGRIIVSP